MTADERLALVRLKIERANHHIDCLKSTVAAFLSGKPYKIATKYNSNRQIVYYIDSAQQVPVEVAAIAGDAIHCIRDALDHLAQQLYLVGNGGSQGYSDQTSFPISKSEKDFKSILPSRVKGMRLDAVNAIAALEPYANGKGHDLWVLHRLNNIDKHRLILTVGSSFNSVDIGGYMSDHMRQLISQTMPGATIPELSLFIRPVDNLFPLEAGKELLIGDVDAQPNEKVGFRFDVAVHEVGLIDGKPVVETIVRIRDLVDGIIHSFRTYLA